MRANVDRFDGVWRARKSTWTVADEEAVQFRRGARTRTRRRLAHRLIDRLSNLNSPREKRDATDEHDDDPSALDERRRSSDQRHPPQSRRSADWRWPFDQLPAAPIAVDQSRAVVSTSNNFKLSAPGDIDSSRDIESSHATRWIRKAVGFTCREFRTSIW